MRKKIDIIVASKPDRPQVGFGDSYTITVNNNVTHGGHCSTCPNPFRPSDKKPWNELYGWLAPQELSFVCIEHETFGKCLLINEGSVCHSRVGNPNHNGQKILKEIFWHEANKGFKNPKWRGSRGCITSHRDEFKKFIDLFEIGERGDIEIMDFFENNGKKKQHKNVLVLDGGGVKGIMQAKVMSELERKTGYRACDMFDLIVGTSVGTILGSLYAVGNMSALEIEELMIKTVPRIFKKRFLRIPMYSRAPFIETWAGIVPPGFKMRQLKTMFMCTSVSICDKKTHYFKSWEDNDGGREVLTCVLRSFAAPVYFGGMVDERAKTVWLDGGTGIDNCPVLEALYEVINQEWHRDGKTAHILSLGAGEYIEMPNFDKAKRKFGRNMREIGLFLNTKFGGLARVQSVTSRIELAMRVAEELNTLTFQRLEVEVSKKEDCLDGVKYIDSYKEYGKKMSPHLKYDLFKI